MLYKKSLSSVKIYGIGLSIEMKFFPSIPMQSVYDLDIDVL